MNKKNIFKIAVDIAMIALFVTFFNIGLLGFKFHVIGGIIFGALILVHIIVNRKWVVNITKRIFDKNLNKNKNFVYNQFLFISNSLRYISKWYMYNESCKLR